jgi:predicted dehydrogenase
MIDEANVDIVDITASVPAHHPVAIHAARAGTHVMVQKPIAISLAAGREMVAVAQEAGVTLAVMEDAHYQPEVLLQRWLVVEGHLGTVQMVLATAVGNSPWSPDRIVAGTHWRHRKEEAGGGIAFDWGVHFFQHFRRVCGPIARVYGSARTFEPVRYGDGSSVESDVDDAMFCHVEFADGAIGQLSLAWAGHGGATELPGGLVIHGSRGCLRGGMAHLDGAEPQPLEAAVRERASAAELDELFPGGIRDPFARGYQEFMTAIREGRPPSYDGHEGLVDLAWVDAAVESSRRGAPQSAEEAMACT